MRSLTPVRILSRSLSSAPASSIAEYSAAEAKSVVSGLIADAGYEPIDLGTAAGCSVMEAPRRPGAVYGEEYRAPEAVEVASAAEAGSAIPPTPRYAED